MPNLRPGSVYRCTLFTAKCFVVGKNLNKVSQRHNGTERLPADAAGAKEHQVDAKLLADALRQQVAKLCLHITPRVCVRAQEAGKHAAILLIRIILKLGNTSLQRLVTRAVIANLIDIAGQAGNTADQFLIYLLCQKITMKVVGMQNRQFLRFFNVYVLPAFDSSQYIPAIMHLAGPPLFSDQSLIP